SIAAERNIGGFGPVVAHHVIYRPDHRVVLQVSRDNVVAGGNKTGDDEVESIGYVVAEDQPVRGVLIATEELRHALAQAVEQRAGLHGQIVTTAAGVDAVRTVELVHEAINAFRLRPDGGCIVEIDQRFFHSCTSVELPLDKRLADVSHRIDNQFCQASVQDSRLLPYSVVLEEIAELAFAVRAGRADILLHVRARTIRKGIQYLLEFRSSRNRKSPIGEVVARHDGEARAATTAVVVYPMRRHLA